MKQQKNRTARGNQYKLYLKMFMRYLHKNHKRLYLLVESEEEGQEAFRYLQKAYSGIQLVGLRKYLQKAEQMTCW